MDLSDPITELKGVGETVRRKLNTANIFTVQDLLRYYPRKYEDYSNLTTINKLRPGLVSIKVIISNITNRYARRGMAITEAIASDTTGSVRLIWFNQPYRKTSTIAGKEYYVSGDFGLKRQHLSIINPSVESVSDFPVNTARIIPIYKEIKDLKSNQIRQLIKSAQSYIDKVTEDMPAWLVEDYKLISRKEAISSVHFPKNSTNLDEAKHRLGFEEIFTLSLASRLNKLGLENDKALKITFNEVLAKQFVKNLPFKLTDEQRRVIWQIYLDMQKKRPMNRLVEGDVGTGKTVVATMAALMVINQGYQVAFMAPTELLAKQHAETIFNLLKPLGYENRLSILTGHLSTKQKSNLSKSLKEGKIQFLVGTHALIQENIDLDKLGLVIIDEQHRFGVEQRTTLQSKSGQSPHILSMSATPIPRSLQLTLYGDLDVSVIKNKPYDSKPIITQMFTFSQRMNMYEKLADNVKMGGQAFIVCPAINNTRRNFISVEKVYEELTKGPLKLLRVAILHSKIKSEEKERIINNFVKHKIDALIATTIVEVGVHVPDANIMVIENAERFGLAQLHQLRGRVGRSNIQGNCYLVMSDDNPPNKRLKALESTNDGFKLAELDLEIRGPGAIYGTLQHGVDILQFAKFTDYKLIKTAQKAAIEFVEKKESLVQYKELNNRVSSFRAVTALN